jgi:hypothetical protein
VPADVPTTVFREWGKANGFRRKGTTLYRDRDETIAVVNLQGSVYGGRYYLNVALWLRAFGDEATPKENHCHLRTRLADLRPPPDDDERKEPFLDMGSGLSDEARRTQFESVMNSVVSPALANTATVADLQGHPEVVRRFAVGREAYDLGLRGLGQDDV